METHPLFSFDVFNSEFIDTIIPEAQDQCIKSTLETRKEREKV